MSAPSATPGGGPAPAGLDRARALAAAGEDEAAKAAYLAVLVRAPAHVPALLELGALAEASGHRSAARTAYAQAIRCAPGHPLAQVALGRLLFEEQDLAAARAAFAAALASDPACVPAQQGLARVLGELGDPAAEQHFRRAFAAGALVRRRYRGPGEGIPLLVLVCARGGNIAIRHWVDDRRFAITALYADFHDPRAPLPAHAGVVNAIGDADLGAEALDRAERLLAQTDAPVLNPPARVRACAREACARRLGSLPGVITPRMCTLPRAELARAGELGFPLLLRSPGFHTGRNFLRVERAEDLPAAAAALPGERLLAIEYLDARGGDGLARKYRVMFLGGLARPLHLAIAPDWKVHYFTAAMAASATHREEERRFLEDMTGVLGARAMAALAAIADCLALDYAGVDFALARDGRVMVFEANPGMVIAPPDPDPMWDYRRPAVAAALAAAARLLPPAPAARAAGR